MYRNSLKRIFDIVISLFLLSILWPLCLVVALLIVTTSKGPVFFKQQRVGKHLVPFVLLKFRTMTDENHEVKKVIDRAEGVTWIGYYLRRTKIDELPQLINVLKGEMSIVGPRPGMFELLEKMDKNFKRRYSVRPGMTGLAQVSGNIHLTWKDRYKYDMLYIRNISLKNDLKIIFRTIGIIFQGEKKYLNNSLYIEIKKNENQ